jgi:NADH-quinone oxidoreductase subunit L
MTEQTSILGWIILLPLIGATINGIFGAIPWKKFPRIPGIAAGVIASACVLGSFVLAIGLFLRLTGKDGVSSAFEQLAFTWIQVGDFNIPMKFRMDGLSGILTLVVTGVGFLIHLYSVGYMSHDENPARYFTYLNMFTSSMLVLILGASLPILFIGWEGVGLCSYLLIGFWFEDIEKAKAGKKAFVVNRVGDFGFLLGMFLIFMLFRTLDFVELREALSSISPEVGFSVLTIITLLLFVGAAGKSAQIPLFVWLPDAMAGPTPVSALIHAATMVTAGVYMCCRLGFLYSLTPITSQVIAVVGVLTAFVAATIAIVQTDIKKVLAYSTVSQLGYMFLAVGVGAYTIAVFHLITHAFFKALMFLGSGSVIHACGGEQDMRKMGGLKKYMPITYWTFVAGTLAIAGVPIFSGFFSKDEILWQTFSSPIGGLPLYIIALATAGLTATYMGRLVVMTFLGKNRSTEEVRHHLHESPLVMTIPLMVLAVLATFGGFLGIPHFIGGNTIHNYLENLLAGIVPANLGHGTVAMEWGLLAVSVVVGLGCLYLSKVLFLDKPEKQKDGKLTAFLYNSYYLNEFYEFAIVKPIHRASIFLWKVLDVIVIDGVVLLSAKISRLSGQTLRLAHTGRLEHYLAALMLGMLVLLAVMVVRVL